MVTTYVGFHLVCCHFDHYTCARNGKQLRVIKYPGLIKFRIPAKFTKLKLIKYFAHVTLVTPKYSRSTVIQLVCHLHS